MGAWVMALFGGIGEIIASWMAKKTIFATALIAGFLALTTAFVAVLHGLQSSLFGVLPEWAVGLGYLIPNNGSVCFSACVAARIARWVYDYHKDVLVASATV